MNHTTSVTSKYQITLPKSVRGKLGIKTGNKIDIFPMANGEFIGRVRTEANILKYAGDLAHLDDNKPSKEIRQAAQAGLAQEAIEKHLTAKNISTIKIKSTL